jgi:uncharacterized damage-inducible protein DinB
MTDDLRFPTGKFHRPKLPMSDAQRGAAIDAIAHAPQAIRDAVRDLEDKQLDTPYREGGWTVRQVVHHVADSHVNAYTRFRLGLTEDAPTVKPYDEAKWAELPDARTAPVAVSLSMIDAVHERWVQLLRAMTPGQFERTVVHPENGVMALDTVLALYAWHGTHHAGHITGLRKREGW